MRRGKKNLLKNASWFSWHSYAHYSSGQMANLKISQRSKRVWQSGSCCRPRLINVRCVQKTHKGVSSCRISAGLRAHQEPKLQVPLNPPVFLQHSADALESCSRYNHQWWSNLEPPLSSLLHQQGAQSVTLLPLHLPRLHFSSLPY